MRQNHPALRGFRARLPAQLLQQVFIRQAMKPVAPEPARRKPARQRQQLRHPRHGAVKGGVEAGELRQQRVALLQGFDERNLAGQVVGVEGADLAQLGQQRRRDALGLLVLQAVHYPVPHCPNGGKAGLLLQPVQQEADGGGLVSRFYRQADWRCISSCVKGELGASHADAAKVAVKAPCRRFAQAKHGKLDARRAAVEGQHAGFGSRGFSIVDVGLWFLRHETVGARVAG